jgi:hypothetical protein
VAIPSDIANLVTWYKADAITGISDGGAVTAWPTSRSGGVATEQPFSNQRPTYETNEINSLPVVRFRTASQDKVLRTTEGFANSAYTILVVFRSTDVDTGASSTIICGDNGSLKLLFPSSNTGKLELVRIGNASLATTTNALTANTSYVAAATVTLGASNTGTAKIHVNGAQEASTTHSQSALSSSTYQYYGGSGVFGSEPLYGDIGEIVVYNAALSDADRGSIESYLGTRWGITISGGSSATSLLIRRRPARGLILR